MGRCLECQRTMKKKKIVIIAPTGMLGNQVYKQLEGKHDLILLFRNKKLLDLLPGHDKHFSIHCDLEEIYSDYRQGFTTKDFGKTFSPIVTHIGDIDGVINCAGIKNPHALQNPELTFFINAAFPQLLSQIYKEKLIQIATDCVFDGNTYAPYDENASKLPTDLY